MINVSEKFRTASMSNSRYADVQVVTNNSENPLFTVDEIIEMSIEKTASDGSIAIGNVISDRLSLIVRTAGTIPPKTMLTPTIKFITKDGDTERLCLGRFKVSTAKIEQGYTHIVAYDALYGLSGIVKWGGIISREIPPLAFPATMQQMLEYICALQSIDCVFECRPFTVQERPEGYTKREIIGFIAASHGGNAYMANVNNLSNEKSLNIKQFTDTGFKLPVSSINSQTFETVEPYTVNGIMFSRGGDSIYIDGDESEYDDENPGIIHADNPFATIEIAEYVWNILGGLSYYGCSVSKSGYGWLECGDIVSVKDVYKDEIINIAITSLTYDFSHENGFTEELISAAESPSESAGNNNRSSISRRGGESLDGMSVIYDILGVDTSVTTSRKAILTMNFSTAKETTPLLSATMQLEIKAAGNVSFYIICDSSILQEFVETLTEGSHFKTITMPILGLSNGGHKVEIAIISENASGNFPKSGSYGTVIGSGLLAESPWDGTITVSETVSPFAVQPFTISVGAITESVVDTPTEHPILITANDVTPPFVVENTDIIANFNETLPTHKAIAYYVDATTVEFIFYNPVYGAVHNLEMFTVQAVISGSLIVQNPINIDKTGTSRFTLTLDTPISTAIGVVYVTYNANNGNLRSSVDGGLIEDTTAQFTF